MLDQAANGVAKLVGPDRNAQNTIVTTTAIEQRQDFESEQDFVHTHSDNCAKEPHVEKLEEPSPSLKRKPRSTGYGAPLELTER